MLMLILFLTEMKINAYTLLKVAYCFVIRFE
jgi:hypothetical protein